jgi:hypothetical protein
VCTEQRLQNEAFTQQQQQAGGCGAGQGVGVPQRITY